MCLTMLEAPGVSRLLSSSVRRILEDFTWRIGSFNDPKLGSTALEVRLSGGAIEDSPVFYKRV